MLSPRQRLRSDKQPQSASSAILDRVDSLIDELLNDSTLSSSSLASILMAARESVRGGYHVALARRTWDASNALRLRQCPVDPDLINSH
jgi:chorismate mutase